MNISIYDMIKTDAKLNTYILFDGAKIEQLPRQLAEIDKAKNYQYLYVGTPFSDLIEVSPCLVEVSNIEDYKEFLSDEIHKQATLIIQSEQSFDGVYRFWQSRVLVDFTKDNPVLFRLYEPDILLTLLYQPNTTSIHQLIGPCLFLYLWSEQRSDWVFYENRHYDEKEKFIERLLLCEGDMSALAQCRINHCLNKLSKYIEKYFPLFIQNCSNTLALSRYLYEKAKKLGFTTEQSLFYFANIWCRLGSDCLDDQLHPEIAVLLTKPSEKTPTQRVERAFYLAMKLEANVTHDANSYLV